jgi:hypothetical protein
MDARRTSAPDTRTLGELVSTLVRRTPDGVLVGCAAAGIFGVALVSILWRAGWWLTPVFLMLAAFGAWGMADRERAALGPRGAGFRALRVVAGFVGAAAAVVGAVMLFVLFVGPLIS